MEKHEIIETLSALLPELITRQVIKEKLSNIISSRTIANLDCLGQGPKRVKIGRRVVYSKKDFLEWLAARTSIEEF